MHAQDFRPFLHSNLTLIGLGLGGCRPPSPTTYVFLSVAAKRLKKIEFKLADDYIWYLWMFKDNFQIHISTDVAMAIV